MFSSHDRLNKRTPENGINRKEYISLLVGEYYETTDVEAQEQVTANLANFAYDPINYAHLNEASVVELFLELIASANPRLILHAIAGLCNLVPDKEARDRIIQANGISSMLTLLRHPDFDIIVNVLAALIQLDSPDTRNHICTQESINVLTNLKQSDNVTVKNLSTILLNQLTASGLEK